MVRSRPRSSELTRPCVTALGGPSSQSNGISGDQRGEPNGSGRAPSPTTAACIDGRGADPAQIHGLTSRPQPGISGTSYGPAGDGVWCRRRASVQMGM